MSYYVMFLYIDEIDIVISLLRISLGLSILSDFVVFYMCILYCQFCRTLYVQFILKRYVCYIINETFRVCISLLISFIRDYNYGSNVFIGGAILFGAAYSR